MPPPGANAQSNPVLDAQLRELSSAIGQMAQIAHANNRHQVKVGEGAERFGRMLEELRGSVQRELRDLLVAVHFTSESISRAMRGHGPGRGGAGGFGGGLGAAASSREQAMEAVRQRYARLEADLGRREQARLARVGQTERFSRVMMLQGLVSPQDHKDVQTEAERRRHSIIGSTMRRRDALQARARQERRAAARTPDDPGVSGLTRALGALGPAVGALVAGMALAATGAKAFYDVSTAMVQAASPHTWKTFTGSIELLMAQVGRGLVPTFVRLALAAQALAEHFGEMSQQEVERKLKDTGAGTADFGLNMLPGLGLLNDALRLSGHPTMGRSLVENADSAIKGLPVPKDPALYVKTAEPRVGAVESVWESMLAGFLGEDELSKRMLEVQQEMLVQMTRTANEAEKGRRPGS